jgi:GT2 family glycosyltransferase
MITRNDDPAILSQVLDAVIAQGAGNPIVLVDMSTGDGVRRVCETLGEAVRYVHLPGSRGVSDSRNAVVSQVDTRYVLFLDSDAVPEPGWAAALRGAFERVPAAAVVGARVLPRWTEPPPRLFTSRFAGDFLSLFDLGDQPLEVPRIMGTSYAIDLERVPEQPFPPELGYQIGNPLGGEEVELSERAARDGWAVLYEPRAVVTHIIGPGRATWPAMLRRAFHAGQEARRLAHRHPPLPRTPTARDRLFQAAIAPAFAAGWALGPRGRGRR